MVDLRLVKYIRQELSKGYSFQQIRQYLINYGYNQNIIDESIAYISNPNLMHEKHSIVNSLRLHMKFLIISGILFMLLMGIILFSPKFFGSSDETYFNPTIQNKILTEGESLRLDFDYSGIEDDATITILKGSEVINQKTVSLDESQVFFSLPQGDYRVKIESEGYSVTEAIRVVSSSSNTNIVNSQNQNNLNNNNNNNNNLGNQNNQNGQTSDQVNNQQSNVQNNQNSNSQFINSGTSSGTTNQFSVEENQYLENDLGCNSLTGTYHDVCLDDNAKATNDPTYCREIINDFRRESCLLRIVTNTNDLELCNEITIEQLLKLCTQLGAVRNEQSGVQNNNDNNQSDNGLSPDQDNQQNADQTQNNIQLQLSTITKNVIGNSVTFIFTTNIDAVPVVLYDTNNVLLSQQKEFSNGMNHNVKIENLQPGTYFYKIRVTNGNQQVESNIDQFVIN